MRTRPNVELEFKKAQQVFGAVQDCVGFIPKRVIWLAGQIPDLLNRVLTHLGIRKDSRGDEDDAEDDGQEKGKREVLTVDKFVSVNI